MAIRLYNTRTRSKEDFVPLDPKNVRMYVCGPTVYDRAHIGNARPVVVFDVLFRLLRHTYGEAHVTYARNFTDVDDKINAKAAETRREGETLEQTVRRITDETIGWYHEDMDALGALRPTHEPRATEYIAQMVAMIKDLIGRGHAYEAEGHVLFEARTDPDYGSLSRRPLDEMRAGARVEVAPYKRDPMDSVLWKPSTEEQPGWDSPWGRGRPGWHIECSAMAGDLLGEAFDIHGGGIDLQFPHHENECAQSRCVGHDFANIWMHNGYLLSEGEKMSKSLGNFFTVADLRAKGVPGEVMRLAMLMTHYRSPIDWTEKRLDEAKQHLSFWQDTMSSVRTRKLMDDINIDNAYPEVVACLKDDLNSPKACHLLFRIATDRKKRACKSDQELILFGSTMELLGFSELRVPELHTFRRDHDKIEFLIESRSSAKAAKDFAKSDSIRDALIAAGVEIKDTSQGAKWSLTAEFDPTKLPDVEDV